MKKTLLVIIILVSCISLKSQNCFEKVEKVRFKYFSIKEKNYSKDIDSIHFIASYPINPNNPTIIFLHGSGNMPLISFIEKDSLNFNLVPPFSIREYRDKYNFIAISKPGTPMCREWINNPPLIDTSFPEVMKFYKMDFLDYYVSQTSQVIDYLKANILSKKTPIYLIGNSQGGHVAVKYTSLHQNKIDKLILYSCGILDRYMEEIYELRKQADCNSISSEEAQKQVNNIYREYKNLKNYVELVKEPMEDKDNYYQAKSNYSYNFQIPLFDLLKINIPILSVYGTDDLKSRDNDLLPMFFIRENKSNLTMMPIPDCDHVFMKKSINKETNEITQEYIGDEVFSKIEKWLSK